MTPGEGGEAVQEGPVLDVDRLSVHFEERDGKVNALHDVTLRLGRGEIAGLVGESGCGKSLTSLAVMKLLPQNAKIREGDIRIDGVSVTGLSESKMRGIRGEVVSMIFQDALTALNPLMPIGRQIEESLLLHRRFSSSERRERVVDLLRSLGIPQPEKQFGRYPFQLSGGMRQRVMIALALACGPKLIIADEPTTALDVTIQAQILDLLKDIRDEYETAILLVTHDMGVIADMADWVAVMYAGQIVEVAPVDSLFERPAHHYTAGLLNSTPDLTSEYAEDLASIPGTVPDLRNRPRGCPFHPRCGAATQICRTEMPPLSDKEPDHAAACWHPLIGEDVDE